MGNFLEEFFFGKMNPETNEVDGGIPGFLDTFVPDPGTTASNLINETLIGQVATAPVRGAAAVVGAGLDYVEDVESYVIARPTSTALQALGINNPLYRDGVSFQDFVDMWNASEYISPGRAGITNIGSGIGMVEAIARGGQDPFTGGATWNEFSYNSGYNPYSSIGGLLPEEVEKKWDDSPLGTIGSLSLDTSFVIYAGGKGVNAAGATLRRAAGTATTIKNARDLGKLRDSMYAHKRWLETGGEAGSRTVPGQLIDDIVKETDFVRIQNSPLLDNWTRSGSFNRDELASILTKTDDYDTVVELMLADRGDPVAIGQMFQAAPDRVWSLMDMNEIMQRQFAAGGQFIPDATTANRIKQTFDTAADRDEFFASVRDIFTRKGTRETGDEGLITSTFRGADFVPMGTSGVPVASNVAGYAQRWLKRTMADARINRPNTWNDIKIPGETPRSPVTTLLFWAGSRRPLNVVSFNRQRPTEVVDEMLAYSRSSRALKQRTYTVTRRGEDGIAENISMPAFQWRAEALQRIGDAKRRGVADLNLVVRDLENELVSVVVNKYAISARESDDVVAGLRQASDAMQAQVAKDGFWLDDIDGRVVLDPVTQSQLPDSLVLMPLDELDWALRSISQTGFARRGRRTVAAGRLTAAGLNGIYRWFRTNVLFRPGYVPKNSIGEPAVAELLADASLLPEGGVKGVFSRVGTNTNRRVLQFKYGVQDRLGRAKRRDAEQMQILQKQYDDLRRQMDDIDLLIDDLDSAGTSPATRDRNFVGAVRERKAVYQDLKRLEAELDVADPAWRQVDEIPYYGELRDRIQLIDDALNNPNFVVNAESRIAQIRSVSSKELNPLESAEVANLERLIQLNSRASAGEIKADEVLTSLRAQLDDIREASFLAEPGVLKRKQKLEAEIAKLDEQRGILNDRIASRVLARERARKREFSGEDDFVIRSNVDGKDYTVPGLFSEEPGMFGTATRADSASDLTAMQTMTAGTFSGARGGRRWRQVESGEVITPFDGRYWDELTYIANRHVRNDKLAAQILSGKTDAEIKAWFRTPEGRSYRESMGWSARDITGGAVDSVKAKPLAKEAGGTKVTQTGPEPRITVFEEGVVARNRRLLNAYFPTSGLRQRLLSGDEVTAGELQSLMGSLPLENLSPIFGKGFEFIGNRAARVSRAVNNAADAVWRNLAVKPETRFGRWPFMQREFRRQMQDEIDFRASTGQVIDGNALQSMRIGASSRALKEVENTFYNIRRMTNPIYALRYVMGFPAAAWNTVYRYYRLGYKAPGNALVLTNSWTNVLTEFGVNEDGEQVDNWKDAYQVVINLPAEWDLPIDSEIKIRADSVNLGTQEGSLLPTATVPITTVLMQKPELDGWMQENMPEMYDMMFPYGPGTDPDLTIGPVPLDPFMASYQRKGITFAKSFFQEIPDEDFARVVVQDYEYALFEWARNNFEGPMPSYKDSVKNAQQYYGVGAFLSWAMFGSYQLSAEGQVYRNEWYRILEDNPDDYAAAVNEFREAYGPEAFFFMMPTSKNRAGMPATQDALAIFKANEGLLGDLREISPSDPRLVAQLLFLDEQTYNQDEFSQAVYDWQFDSTLPGDIEPIKARLSPQEVEDEVRRSQSWAMYNDSIAQRDALMLQYGYARLSSDDESSWLYNQWNGWLSDFKNNPDNALWYDEFSERSSEKSFRVLNGIDAVLNDSNFMSKFGQTQTWEMIGMYRQELEEARSIYNSVETSEQRKAVAEQWDQHVRSAYLPVAGNFAGYYERYLAGRDLVGRQLLDIELDIPRFPIPSGADTSGVQ